MKAVILAAGKSTRTYPLTVNKPKPLLKVANKMILEHNLDQLQGIVDEAIVIVGFEKEQIIHAFGKKYGKIKLTYVDQKEQLGTGHALSLAKDKCGDRFIVMGGDDLFSKEDIKRCVKHKYCVLAQKVKNPESFGVFVVHGKTVNKIVEKPQKFVSDLANTGLYVFDKQIFSMILEKSPRGEYELTDYINKLIAKGEMIYCEEVKDYWLPIVYPWSLLDANEFLLKRIKVKKINGTVEKGVVIKGRVIIGKNTIVKSGVYIEGPVVIGEDCNIGPNCYIRPCTSIGNKCKIGQSVEIKNSVIMDHTNVPHLSYVGDSVIGSNSNLGAGTKVANLRHDNGNVRSAVKGVLIDTGRRKLGMIIGDHVKTGINTLIYPGRKIWPHKTTLPGEIVKEDIV